MKRNKMTIEENLQIKLLQIRKELRKLLVTTQYAINDINKLNQTSEEVDSEECKEV